ncbi:hypothetical protein [Pseudonocardia nigra]|jgi:hypothetical protein|uniref:hypothetical protein n=1 Tax=Pseudonocardia nigra TaxID=1921578 RepID=UPI001C5FF883|nr:hypothetical protein [Pseudonocardia nigra]
MRRTAMLVLSAALLAACSAGPAAPTPAATDPVAPSAAADAAGQRFPDIVEVEATRTGDGYSFAVTVSSPYDTPERYADAFRVRAQDGTVYGVTELTHDHATEQPFTRSLSNVTIPAEVTSVVVEGRDQANGWGGGTRTVELPT